MKSYIRAFSTPTFYATTLLTFSLTAQAATVNYALNEHQTVDTNGLFPANGSNNIDKFDTTGTAHNTVAPFTTTAYVRAGTSTAAANLPRRTQLLIQFDLSGLDTETISTATLTFDAYSLNDGSTNNPDLFVGQVTNDWAPGGTPDPTFNPSLVGTAINAGSVVSGTGLDIYDSGLTLTGSPAYRNTASYVIDVKSIVENWQAGSTNNGFHLELGDSTNFNQGIGLDTSSVFLNVTTVPEPSSVALLGLGSLALFLRRRG